MIRRRALTNMSCGPTKDRGLFCDWAWITFARRKNHSRKTCLKRGGKQEERVDAEGVHSVDEFGGWVFTETGCTSGAVLLTKRMCSPDFATI